MKLVRREGNKTSFHSFYHALTSDMQPRVSLKRPRDAEPAVTLEKEEEEETEEVLAHGKVDTPDVPRWARDTPANPMFTIDDSAALPSSQGRADVLTTLNRLFVRALPLAVASARFVTWERPNFAIWTTGKYHVHVHLAVLRCLVPAFFPDDEIDDAGLPSCATFGQWLHSDMALEPRNVVRIVLMPRLIAATLWSIGAETRASAHQKPAPPSGLRPSFAAQSTALNIIWALNLRAPSDGRVDTNWREMRAWFDATELRASFVCDDEQAVRHLRHTKGYLVLTASEFLRCRDILVDMLRTLATPVHCLARVWRNGPAAASANDLHNHSLVWPAFTQTYPLSAGVPPPLPSWPSTEEETHAMDIWIESVINDMTL